MRPWQKGKEQCLESDEADSDAGSEELDEDESDAGSEESFDTPSEIWSTLQKLKTPVAFAFGAASPSLPNPGIQILHHGLIGLPLSSDDAKKIISQASLSPFGRGEKTIVDESVRKCWELNPGQFSLENAEWSKAMKIILDSVTIGLGISAGTENISAELYKLLLYEPGSFFKPHKDSVKASGMFATLVVCLPSPHEGGKLILTHDNKKYEFETAATSRFSTSYAIWYSDITHEILPIKSGYRLMLTYNLIRKTNFVVPSYNLARGLVQHLSKLLQQYNLQLEEGDDELPPFLLHKLKHKYTQANLSFNLLKTQDLTQVLTLKELSKEIGFDIYLAILELTVNKDDEFDDWDVEKSLDLTNVVELNGNLVVESLDCPDNALIDPTPQDEGEADEENHEGPTGNAGSPATYWYRDTTVVLVPPSKQLDFVFKFSSNGNVIKPLFSKLMQKFLGDIALKPELEKLCKLALKQNGYEHYSGTVCDFYQQAAAAVLGLGRFELFDEACTKTKNKIIPLLDIPQKLGDWAAKKGLAAMRDRLSKGLLTAPTISKKINFLESVARGFNGALQGPSFSAKKVDFKQWSNEALLSAISKLNTFSKADGVSLGQLHKIMNWDLLKSNLVPIISRATTIVRIAFTNEFMSSFRSQLNEEQSSFIQSIILTIWKDFVFDSVQQESKTSYILNAIDLHLIIENTIRVISLEYVEAEVIPTMINAIPKVSTKCSKELFIELVQLILKNEQAGFRLPTIDSVPPISHRQFVQALLIKFLVDNVGVEPQAPKNWSLPVGCLCKCKDCSTVINFLQNPSKQRLDFPCSKPRRYHLHQKFTDRSDSSYDVVTIRTHNPNIWRITKNRRGHEMVWSEWSKRTATAIDTLVMLKNCEQVRGKLEMYLQPYYNLIIKASVKELPDLKHLVSTNAESNDAGPAHSCSTNQGGVISLKRGARMTDSQNPRIVKRTK
ncbi:unnamed protein product [Bemisia tabaci]|uniref:Prolyl 4-hydroxylase alpha subunit Fe(2+) 2OG dioxygenase domain-containing protein n=1 Tax=Bemisia tabaci TaxID=7038 RepID=A0A9P0AF46_BEMTA|nr:unnamed protein product [Bemisia tabaci]